MRSNYFTADLNGAREVVYIADVPNDDVMAPVYSGQGILQLKLSTNQVVAQNLGTIDYDTGSLDITSMTVTDVSGSGNDDILVVVSSMSLQKIFLQTCWLDQHRTKLCSRCSAQVRNIILSLDDSIEDLPNNIKRGVNVTVVPRITDD